jgi:uncharacterized damage-inducible protein DinB
MLPDAPLSAIIRPMDPELFLQRWTAARGRTEALIDSASAVSPEFTPRDGYRSIAAQIAHIIAAQMTITEGLESGRFAWAENNEQTSSVPLSELVETSQELTSRLVAMLREKDRAWFEEKPYPKHSMSRSDWLWALLEHEIHHAGQLSLMIRLAGGEPARVFL